MTAPLQFTQVREDPLVDLAVLQASTPGDRHVLLVASGGCTALSLLLDDSVHQIDAVDFNPTQTALVRLKRAAIAALTLAEYREFLGIDAGDPLRYWPRIAKELPATERLFWESQRSWLQQGLQAAGNYEKLFALWRQFMHQFVADPADLKALCQADSLAAQQALFERFHPGYWPVGFTLAFHHDFLNTMFSAKATQHARMPYPSYFERVFRRAMTEIPAHDNYFLAQLLLDEYLPGPNGLPPYLQPAHYPVVQARLDRLHCHHGTFPTFLQTRQGPPYALVQLSNILDWLSHDERSELATSVLPHVAPGSRILSRQLNNDEPLPEALRRIAQSDSAWEHALWQQERSFFYERLYAPVVTP